MRERRSEDRFLCSNLVKVVSAGGHGAPAESVANLEDISPSGACVQLESALEGLECRTVTARLSINFRQSRF